MSYGCDIKGKVLLSPTYCRVFYYPPQTYCTMTLPEYSIITCILQYWECCIVAYILKEYRRNKDSIITQTVVDLWFSKKGVPTPNGGVPTYYFFKIVAEHCMKVKDFGTKGGHASVVPPWICQF